MRTTNEQPNNANPDKEIHWRKPLVTRHRFLGGVVAQGFPWALPLGMSCLSYPDRPPITNAAAEKRM
jgi:hypothetical protein